MKFKRSWERKLDKLKIRASRVMTNLQPSDPAVAKDLLDQIKRDGSIPLAKSLLNPAVVEVGKRLDAVRQEHSLDIDVLGCHVVLTLHRHGYHLSISSLRGGEPCPRERPWVAPAKFEKIRKLLGAPEKPVVRGDRALHWSWKVGEPQ